MKSTLSDLRDWPLRWYPEIQLGVLLSLVLSLAFPPFAIDGSPGQTAFLGWHSLFTQEAGYVSLSRLWLFWLLVLVVAACAQISAQRCGDSLPNPVGAFATPVGSTLLSGNGLLAVVVALPTWFFLCGLVLGRTRILGLENQLAYLGCVAFQLIVISRLMIWISRDRTNLTLSYLILGVASLAWDLRTSPTPEARVAGLVPLYVILGYLLYRFDLRFAYPASTKPVPAPAPAGGDTSPVQETPHRHDQPPAAAPVLEPDPPDEPEPEPVNPPVGPLFESESQERQEDPYQRYRPKPLS